MKMKYILLFVIVLFIGVSSCNDDIPFQDESEFAKSTKSLAVTDSLVMPIILDDIEYLARLLYREFNIMSEVIGSSEGSDNDI